MMSSAGNTASAAPDCDAWSSVSSADRKRPRMTPGSVGYLLYEMRIEWPSHPDSIAALLSPVPSRASIRLRSRRRPQFRIAQLFFY